LNLGRAASVDRRNETDRPERTLRAGRDLRRRARAVRVDISGFAYHPRTLRVRHGTKVVLCNGDPVAHTTTRWPGLNPGRIQLGHPVAVRLHRRGVDRHYRTIHSFMHDKAVVP
jgi:plastocyanin